MSRAVWATANVTGNRTDLSSNRHGYAHTSARDLVTASGTNLGAIGYHFGSKEALLNEAITHNIREWIDVLGELLRRHTSQGNGLQTVLDELITKVDRNEPLVTAFFERSRKPAEAASYESSWRPTTSNSATT